MKSYQNQGFQLLSIKKINSISIDDCSLPQLLLNYRHIYQIFCHTTSTFNSYKSFRLLIVTHQLFSKSIRQPIKLFFNSQRFIDTRFLNSLALSKFKLIILLYINYQLNLKVAYLLQSIFNMQEQHLITNKQKIIVIGAGLSGLSAANQLLTKILYAEVLILQALDRVGGKSYTVDIHGTKFDLGAQYIGPTQHFAIDLANKAKAQFVNQPYEGKKIMILNGVKSIYHSNIPNNVNIISLLQMQWCIWKVNRMAAKIPLSDPQNCQLGAYWDSMTLKTWIQNNVWDMKVRVLFQLAVRTLLGSELSQISVLYFLWFVGQNKNFDNLVNIQKGLQQKKLKGGTQQLSIYLQKQIEQKNGRIIFNQYVIKVKQTKQQITVQTDTNQYKCKYLIFASSPSTMQKIRFQPSLSIQRRFITQKSNMGVLVKFVILYDKQYWKEKGFSGQIISDCTDCPIVSGFDDTKFKQNGQAQAALIVFVGGGVYRYWKQQQQFQNILLKKLATYFQIQQLKKPLAIKWHPFDDYPSLGGGPLSILSGGSLSQITSLRKPEGKIHFAGTQMATVSIGYMDGAIQSGLRSAKQIIDDLNEKNEKNENKIKQKKKQKNDIMWYSSLIRAPKKCFQWW